MSTVKPQKVFTAEELLRRSIGPKVSPKMQAHLRRLHARNRGKEPRLATAGTLATRKLHALGLKREEAPRLWELYRDLYLKWRDGELAQPERI